MIECNGNIFDEEDRDLLVDDIKNIAPELLDKYSPNELASLYCDYSEEIWCASWEDGAEGEFVLWLKNPEEVRKRRIANYKSEDRCNTCEYNGTQHIFYSPCNSCKDYSEYSDKEKAKIAEEINNTSEEAREQLTKDILKEFMHYLELFKETKMDLVGQVYEEVCWQDILFSYKKVIGEDYDK